MERRGRSRTRESRPGGFRLSAEPDPLSVSLSLSSALYNNSFSPGRSPSPSDSISSHLSQSRLLRSACRLHNRTSFINKDQEHNQTQECLCVTSTRSQSPNSSRFSPRPTNPSQIQELDLSRDQEFGRMSRTHTHVVNNSGDHSLYTPNRPRSRTRRAPPQPSPFQESHNSSSSSRHLVNGSISFSRQSVSDQQQARTIVPESDHGSRIQISSSSSGTRVHEHEESIQESFNSTSEISESFIEKTKSVCASLISSKSEISNMSYWNSGTVKNGGWTDNRRFSNIYYTSDDDEYETETINPHTPPNYTNKFSLILKPFRKFQTWVTRIFKFIGINIYSLVMLSFVIEKWLLNTHRSRIATHGQSRHNGTSSTFSQPHVGSSSSSNVFGNTATVPEHGCPTGRSREVSSLPSDGNAFWKKLGWLIGFIGLVLLGILLCYLLGGIGFSKWSPSTFSSRMTVETLDKTSSTSAPVTCERDDSKSPLAIEILQKEIMEMRQIIVVLSGKVTNQPPPPVDNSFKIKDELKSEIDQKILTHHNQVTEMIRNQKPTYDPSAVRKEDHEADISQLQAEIMNLKDIIKNFPVPTCNCPPPVVSSEKLGSTRTCSEDCVDLVAQAIAKYDADKTGVPDLALESAGGSVVSTRCTKRSDFSGATIRIFGLPIWFPSNSPRKIIQPGTMPGDCWSFDGAEGFAVLKLVGPTMVTGFTLEHLAKSLSPLQNIDSAPRHFKVVGLNEVDDTENEHVFGEYEYKEDGLPLQYFEVQNSSAKAFPYVELKVTSNHGNPVFTCIYRFRVHGILEM